MYFNFRENDENVGIGEVDDRVCIKQLIFYLE